MAKRIFNFSAGPAALPTEVLEKAQSELLDYQGSGMSIMEMSHRGKYFDEVLASAEAKARKLMKLGDEYAVLFLQGGASHQFAMVPMNFASPDRPVDMVHTGYWTKKAIGEIERITSCRIIASSEDTNFDRLPEVREEMIHPDAAYVHYCSNNTVYGTQWRQFVHRKNVPSVVDMSSDFLSRNLDFTQFDLIFAGAQKNLGPSGLAMVVIKKSFAETGNEKLPLILQYRAHIQNSSRYHTPPTFAIYLARLVLDWLDERGGLEAIETHNQKKAKILYDAIDESDFYQCPVQKDARSLMNVVFRIDSGNEDLENKFVAEASSLGLDGLKGHRHIGGIRASIYNAMPIAGVERLVEFMKDFEKREKA